MSNFLSIYSAVFSKNRSRAKQYLEIVAFAIYKTSPVKMEIHYFVSYKLQQAKKNKINHLKNVYIYDNLENVECCNFSFYFESHGRKLIL